MDDPYGAAASMGSLSQETLQKLLLAVADRYREPATIVLLGGCALALLGSPRPTLDIDYVGSDLDKNDLQQLIEQVADEMKIEIEAVPIEQFIPLPEGADERKIHVDRYGSIDVYILDPYAIALSKLDRGFESDIEDVLFLIQHNLVEISQLESVVAAALERANEFDMVPSEVRNHLDAVRNQI